MFRSKEENGDTNSHPRQKSGFGLQVCSDVHSLTVSVDGGKQELICVSVSL